MRNMLTKKVILTVVIVLGMIVVLYSKSKAQDIKLTTYMEKTQVSPKIGTSFGYRFACSFEFGGFFQREITPGFSEDVPEKREEEFAGIYFGVPILCKEKYHLDFQVRTGYVNSKHFTITPSAHFTYRPVSFLGISVGAGVRGLRPTIIPKIDITF